jgi:hypothetical protein
MANFTIRKCVCKEYTKIMLKIVRFTMYYTELGYPDSVVLI